MGMTRAQIKTELAALEKRETEIKAAAAAGSIKADEAERRLSRVAIMREEYTDRAASMRESGSTMKSLETFLSTLPAEVREARTAKAKAAAAALDAAIKDLREALEGAALDGHKPLPRWFINRTEVKAEGKAPEAPKAPEATAPEAPKAEAPKVEAPALVPPKPNRAERRAAKAAAAQTPPKV